MSLLKYRKDFLLNKFPTLGNLAGLVREGLGWMDEDYEVRFECRIDIGSHNDLDFQRPHRLKRLSSGPLRLDPPSRRF
jgi:hypothetical protein